MQDFERLIVWQKAHRLSLECHFVAQTFRRTAGVTLASQLRRAALSVPSNIAEGAGKASEREFARFLQIALGSAFETRYHLLVARDLGLLREEQHAVLSERTQEVRRMLIGLLRKVAPPPAFPM